MTEYISGSDILSPSYEEMEEEEEVEEEEYDQQQEGREQHQVVAGQVGAVLPDVWTSNRREIGHEGVWTISTAKPGM